MPITAISDVFVADTATNRAPGAQTATVNIPAGVGYALISMGCWPTDGVYDPALNPVTLDGVACALLGQRRHGIEGNGVDVAVFGVELGPTNEGNGKTFAWTNNVGVAEGGVIHFQWLSGVNYTGTLVDTDHDGGYGSPSTYTATSDVVAGGYLYAMTVNNNLPTWSGVDLVGSLSSQNFKRLTIGARAQAIDDAVTVQAIGVQSGAMIAVSLRPISIAQESEFVGLTATLYREQSEFVGLTATLEEIPGADEIIVEFNDSTVTTFPLLVQQPEQVILEFNDSEVETFELEVTQARSIVVQFNDQTVETFPPLVQQPTQIIVGFNDSTVQTFEPVVQQPTQVVVGFNDSEIQTFPLQVLQPTQVVVEFNDSSVVTFPVVVETGQEINLIFNDSKVETFPLLVQQPTIVEALFNDSNIIEHFPVSVTQPTQVIAGFNDSTVQTFETEVFQPTNNVTVQFNDSTIITFPTQVEVGIFKRFIKGRGVIVNPQLLRDRGVVVLS